MHKLVPGLAFPKTIPKLFPNCSQTVFVTHVSRALRASYSVSTGAKATSSDTYQHQQCGQTFPQKGTRAKKWVPALGPIGPIAWRKRGRLSLHVFVSDSHGFFPFLCLQGNVHEVLHNFVEVGIFGNKVLQNPAKQKVDGRVWEPYQFFQTRRMRFFCLSTKNRCIAQSVIVSSPTKRTSERRFFKTSWCVLEVLVLTKILKYSSRSIPAVARTGPVTVGINC